MDASSTRELVWGSNAQKEMATGEKGPATELDSAPAVCCGGSATRAIAPAIPHLPSHYAPVILELVKPLYSEPLSLPLPLPHTLTCP